MLNKYKNIYIYIYNIYFLISWILKNSICFLKLSPLIYSMYRAISSFYNIQNWTLTNKRLVRKGHNAQRKPPQKSRWSYLAHKATISPQVSLGLKYITCWFEEQYDIFQLAIRASQKDKVSAFILSYLSKYHVLSWARHSRRLLHY